MNIRKSASAFRKMMTVGLAAVMLFVTVFLASPLPAYAGSSVYDIQIIHNGFYGYGVAATLQGSSTDPSKPTYGDRVWVGSAEWDSKCYYEAGSDYLSIKFVLQRNNGTWQPGDNYIYGTVKYDGHTVNINNWGPFTGSYDWNTYSELKMKKRSVTFDYGEGRNYDYQAAPITVTFYDGNDSNDNSISEVFSEQPWWTAYGTFGSIFDGWYTEPVGGTKIEEYDITKLDGSIDTLYAHFIPTYTVELVGYLNLTAQGGTIDSYGHIDITVPQGEAIDTITYTANDGYHFDKFDDIVTNGITVTRVSDKVVTVSGTPTRGVYILIPDRHKYGEWTKATEPTCSAPGQEERVCSKDPTIKETRDYAPIDSEAHDWSDWVETSHATCISPAEETRICSHNAEHKETRVGAPIEASAHDWGEIIYTWSDDNSSVTAKRVCAHDASHVEEETVVASSEVIEEPTTTSEGIRSYTVSFINPAFEQQSRTESIAKLEPEEPISYRNTNEGESTWTEGSATTAVFTFKRSSNDESTLEHFEGIEVDGDRVDASNYEVERGSVVIKLKPEYLETLSDGEHIITALFNDGNSASAEFTILGAKENDTNDNKQDSIKEPAENTNKQDSTKAPAENTNKQDSIKAPAENTNKQDSTKAPAENTNKQDSIKAPAENTNKQESIKAPAENTNKQDSIKAPAENTNKQDSIKAPAENTGKKDSTKTPAENTNKQDSIKAPAENTGKKDSTKAPAENASKQESTKAPTENASKQESTKAPAENASKQESTKAPTENASKQESTKAPTENASKQKSTKAPTDNASKQESTKAPTENTPAENSEKLDSAKAPTENTSMQDFAKAPAENGGNANTSAVTKTVDKGMVILWIALILAFSFGICGALHLHRRNAK